MPSGHQDTNQPPHELDRLEHKENEVWRLAILMLVVLAIGVAVLSQEAVTTRLPSGLKAAAFTPY